MLVERNSNFYASSGIDVTLEPPSIRRVLKLCRANSKGGGLINSKYAIRRLERDSDQRRQGEEIMADISRRTMVKATGAIGASMLPAGLALDDASARERQKHKAPPAPEKPPAAPAPATETPTPSLRTYRLTTAYLFFNDDEAAFIESAVARLIPKDDQWAGALEAGVPNYIG